MQPWGGDWAQADLLAWIMHAVNRGPGAETLPVGHFLPYGFPVGITPGPPKPPDPEAVAAKMNLWMAMAGIPIDKAGD